LWFARFSNHMHINMLIYSTSSINVFRCTSATRSELAEESRPTPHQLLFAFVWSYCIGMSWVFFLSRQTTTGTLSTLAFFNFLMFDEAHPLFLPERMSRLRDVIYANRLGTPAAGLKLRLVLDTISVPTVWYHRFKPFLYLTRRHLL
jgi:hypothetical protein